MNKNVKNSNETQNPKLGISDVMYRLFWYSIFLIVPYLFISYFTWDICWVTSKKLEMVKGFVTGFNPMRILFGFYAIFCFAPCVILGVWTPKGMRECDYL